MANYIITSISLNIWLIYSLLSPFALLYVKGILLFCVTFYRTFTSEITTMDITAIATADYTALSMEDVNFAADSEEAMVTLTITGDDYEEGLEHLQIKLTLDGATADDTDAIDVLNKAIVFIIDDDEKSKPKVKFVMYSNYVKTINFTEENLFINSDF